MINTFENSIITSVTDGFAWSSCTSIKASCLLTDSKSLAVGNKVSFAAISISTLFKCAVSAYALSSC